MPITFFDVETTGLDPFQSKIITIQIRRNGKTTIFKEWELGEPEMIESFFDFVKEIRRREEIFIGYNILKFDVPFLVQRLHGLEIFDKQKWKILCHELRWVDLYQLLGDAYYTFYRFGDWFKLAGMQTRVPGRDIPRLYTRKKFDKIIEHVEVEMKAMEIVYSKIVELPFYEELRKIREEAHEKVLGKPSIASVSKRTSRHS